MRTKPTVHVFLTNDALWYLAEQNLNKNPQGANIIVDPLEVPYYCVMKNSRKAVTMNMYKREEVYWPDEGKATLSGQLEYFYKNGDARGGADDEKLYQFLQTFLYANLNLSDYVRANKLEDMDIPPEEGGILVGLENGELVHRTVMGFNRPNLLCMGMLGGVVKGRPYYDEFIERSMLENMSFEKKLELAESGSLMAMDTVLGTYLYGNEDEGIEADIERGIYWMRKMADAGLANGMYNLGVYYSKGYGVPRDFELAAYWMEKAAEAGDADAIPLVTRFREIADSKAKAEAGDAPAQAKLAEAYMHIADAVREAGPESDYAEAIKWAKKAAEQQELTGIYVLASAYKNGYGLEQDYEKAVELYTFASKEGHPASMDRLGRMYVTGDGVERDVDTGLAWLKKAARLGDPDAIRALDKIFDLDENQARAFYNEVFTRFTNRMIDEGKLDADYSKEEFEECLQKQSDLFDVDAMLLNY